MHHSSSSRRWSRVIALVISLCALHHAKAAPGSLDATFGNGGIVISDLGSVENGGRVIVLPDGRLLLFGTNALNNPGLSLTLFNNNGSVATGFGVNGTLFPDENSNFGASGRVHRMPDGKMLVAGALYSGNLTQLSDLAVLRLNANGTIDTTFGTSGIATVKAVEPDTFNESGTSVAVQSDGKIVLTGWVTRQALDWDIAVVRFTANGQLDTTFGTNGRVVIDSSNGNDRPDQVIVLSDDSILISGQLRETAQNFLAASLIKLTPDGAFDTSFGDNGITRLRTDVNDDTGRGVHVLANGKILLAINGTAKYTVARYNANGTLDSSFGNNGVASVTPVLEGTFFPTFGFPVLLVQPNERIVIAGAVQGFTQSFQMVNRIGAIRFNVDGSVDTTFGTNGHFTSPAFPENAIVSPIDGAVDLEGRLLVSGYIPKNDDDRWMLRLIGDGNEPPIVENTPPVANDDSYSTPKNSILNVAAPGVLDNDTDADGDALTAELLTSTSNGTLVLNPNGSFTYTPDTDYTGEDSFTYQANDAEDSSNSATVTITVTDTLPELRIANNSASEAADSIAFTVTLSAPLTIGVTVDYATSDDTAIAGSDYTATSGTLTFAPGVQEQTIQVSLIDDDIDEDDVAFSVTLSNPANATLGTATAIGTILDDDALEISISSTSVNEHSDTPPSIATLAVTLNRASAFTVSVDYASGGGTATAAEDYEAASGTLSFAPGETEKSIDVTILDDNEVEGDETFNVTLSNQSRGTLVQAVGIVTIIDDDVPSLSIGDAEVTEGDSGVTPAIFEVTLSSTAPFQITVQYATSDDTATAGSDYTATSGTLTFPPGETTRTVTVDVLGDNLVEGPEQFFVTLSNPTNASLDRATGIGTILDDDVPELALTIAPTSISEGAGANAAIGTVTRNTSTDEPLTVNLSSSDITEAAVPENVTILSGNYTATFAIDAVDDDEVDGVQVVTITATADGHATATATIDVLDNDKPQNMVYSLQVRGRTHGDGAALVVGNGYLVIDLDHGRTAAIIKYTNEPDVVANPFAAFRYRANAGARGYWLLTTGSNLDLEPANVAGYRYLHLLGAAHPQPVPIGGGSTVEVVAAFNGIGIEGTDSGELTGSYTTTTLAARILLPASRQFNNDGTSYDELVDHLADVLGIVNVAVEQGEIAEAAAPTNVTLTTVNSQLACYTLRANEAQVGNGSIATRTFGGYLLIDYATNDMKALLAWRQGNSFYYRVSDWASGNGFANVITVGNNNFRFMGESQIDMQGEGAGESSFLHLLGRLESLRIDPQEDPVGVARTLSGVFYEHLTEDGVSGVYTQGSVSASIRQETIQFNLDDLTIDEAMQVLIDSLPQVYQPYED